MPQDIYQPSPFPSTPFSQVMGSVNPAISDIANMITVLKQNEIMKKTLGEYLGGVPQEKLPVGMQSLYNVPVRRIAGLQNIFGPSLTQMLAPKDPSVPLFWDPTQNKFIYGAQPQGSPAMPVPGAKAPQAVSALKQGIAEKNTLTDQQVGELADKIQAGDVGLLKNLASFGANSPKNRVVSELAHRGVNLSNLDLDYQAKQTYVRTMNSGPFQNTLKYLKSVSPNLDRVISMSDDIQRTFVKPINKAQLIVMKNTGNEKAAAYSAMVLEVSDQIAKILQGGGTGSGTSDAKLKQAEEILNSSFTPGQVRSIAVTLKDMLHERETALSTNTLQTMSNQKMPKKDRGARFQELIKKGKTKEQAYAQMHEEGY